MEFRRLGRSGLQVSVLSFGSWVSFGEQIGIDRAVDCLHAAYEAGVNFFDNAESYAGGESERIMGEAIAKLGWARHSYVISTKLYWGLHDVPNMQNTLNRKYLMQAIDGSLRAARPRLRRPACSATVPTRTRRSRRRCGRCPTSCRSGKALYWGTSEWTADEIRAAWAIAERHHLAQAGDGAAAVQPARARGGGVEYRASTTTSGSASPRGARSRSVC